MSRWPLALSLLAFTSWAQANVVFKGATSSLLMTPTTVQVLLGKTLAFDARTQGQKLLRASPCQTLSYRVLPLSKVGTTFSLLEETYLEGPECGLRGHSYHLGVRAINLQTGKDVGVTQLATEAAVVGQLQRDTYLRKLGATPGWTARTLDDAFMDWNVSHCAQTVSPGLFRQVYVFDARTQPAQVRLALPFVCPDAADDVAMPTQVGVLLRVPFNRGDDFDFRSIRDRVGQGVTIELKK